MILSEHLVRCDTDGIDYNTHWYKWTVGRLQQVFLSVSYKLIIIMWYWIFNIYEKLIKYQYHLSAQEW